VVSVRYSPDVERSDRLHQSVDVAIQQALVERQDPLALSFYLWVIKKNQHSVVSLSQLTSWGMAHVRRVLVDLQIGRRRDEEVASAALVTIALSDTPEFAAIHKTVRTGLETILIEEGNSGNQIPLKQPAYGALLLKAAHTLGVDKTRWRAPAERVVSAFGEAIPGGRLFGLVFAAQLVQVLDDEAGARNLENLAIRYIGNDATDFEDQPYLLQAPWYLTQPSEPPSELLMSLTSQLLKKAPVWQYLMNGDEHVPAAGDGQAVVYISHLYRAALFDVVLQYQAHIVSHREEEIDRRYRAHPSLNRAAFGFYVLSLLLVWCAIGYYLFTRADSARRYWILGEFAAMPPMSALFYLCVTLAATYLLVVTVIVMPMIWFVLVIVAVLLGVATNLIAPTFKHLFAGETWTN